MSRQISVAPATPVFPWWLVLGLVGVDYFSTLAYLPAMALESAGAWAPWAAVLVAAITLLVALPVYSYVVGRSPHGTGATGLIEKTIPGWRGKLLVLLLMGFVAADFVITRSLSTADAAVHVLANPTLAGFVDQSVPTANQVKGWLGDRVGNWLTPYWNRQVGVTLALLLKLFNGIILLVTVVFKASVSAQEWAYSTSVQVLLAGACLAASADLWRQWRGWWFRPLMVVPAVLALLFFSGTAGLTVWQNGSGLAIALAFVVALLASSFLSRWLRSTEMRFEGFTFADSRTMERWHEICRVDFQVLVPHRPGLFPLWRKNEEIRKMHRLPADAHLVFIEVELGDPSDFLQKPLMRIEKDDGLEVIRLTRAVSVAHVLAAIGLEWRNVGRPPEIIFGWSLESPLTANLNFLLFGEGNVPWMVQQLLVKAEPDEARRPRIVIG